MTLWDRRGLRLAAAAIVFVSWCALLVALTRWGFGSPSAVYKLSPVLAGTLSAGESASVICLRDDDGTSHCSSWHMQPDGCLTGWLGGMLILSEKKGSCLGSQLKVRTGF